MCRTTLFGPVRQKVWDDGLQFKSSLTIRTQKRKSTPHFITTNIKIKLETTDKRTDTWWDIFMIWKIDFGCGLGWAVGKKVWADYEQLLREVFSTFCVQKRKKIWKHCSVRTEKLHRKKVKIFFIFFGKNFFFQKNQFFLGLKIPL